MCVHFISYKPRGLLLRASIEGRDGDLFYIFFVVAPLGLPAPGVSVVGGSLRCILASSRVVLAHASDWRKGVVSSPDLRDTQSVRGVDHSVNDPRSFTCALFRPWSALFQVRPRRPLTFPHVGGRKRCVDNFLCARGGGFILLLVSSWLFLRQSNTASSIVYRDSVVGPLSHSFPGGELWAM